MNNFASVILISNAAGNGFIGGHIPIEGTAYAGIALNVITFLLFSYRIVKRSKQDPAFNYWYGLLASFLGILGNAIFFFSDTYVKGFWIVKMSYNSFIWLSCLTSFLPLSKAAKELGDFRVSHIGRYSMLFVYCWVLVSIITGIVITSTPMEVENNKTVNFRFKDVDGLFQYINAVWFAYFSNWGFVILFLLLVCAFYSHINKIPRCALSLLLFGIFSSVTVITDTVNAIIFSDANRVGGTDNRISLTSNFILTDGFSFLSLLVVFYYCKNWVYTERRVAVVDEEIEF